MGLLGMHTVNYPTRHDIQSQELLSQQLGEDVGRLQRIQEKADLASWHWLSCGMKWRSPSTDVHLYLTELGNGYWCEPPWRPVQGQNLDRNGMSGFLAKPYLPLPSGRKETRSREKKEKKKKIQRYNYQLNLRSSTHPIQIRETKLPLGSKLSWLVWKLILKFPRWWSSFKFYALLWAPSNREGILCTSIEC